MVLQVMPWADELALPVFQFLDHYDLLEAAMVRGEGPVTGHGLWADWRAMNAARAVSHVACVERAGGRIVPFAVLGIANTGQGGVAQAALLCRAHRTFRREIAMLGILLRRELPAFAATTGIRRIEARSWSHHPTAGRLLSALGFELEAIMPGFGPDGGAIFHQYARLFSPGAPVMFPARPDGDPADGPSPHRKET